MSNYVDPTTRPTTLKPRPQPSHAILAEAPKNIAFNLLRPLGESAATPSLRSTGDRHFVGYLIGVIKFQ